MVTNDAQLIEMERLMRSAPEPGGLENVSMGDEGVAVTKTTVESAGHVIMWNTDTFESSVFNMNSIRSKLAEVFPTDHPHKPGLPAWTATQPTGEVWHGTATCPLHSSRPERASYSALGYPECTRIELPNEMEAQEHLRKKHPTTWRQMNEARAEVERLAQVEDRTLNRLILAKLAGVDLDEPVVAAPVQAEVPSVWDYPPTAGQTLDDFHEETQVPSHVHRYGRAMGSKCKVANCTTVRTTEYKARKK